MQDEVRKRVEEIVGGMKCPKAFKCVESGFERLCKARDLGLDDYLDCLDEDSNRCPFAMPFGHGHFCCCPLRVYIAKKLKK